MVSKSLLMQTVTLNEVAREELVHELEIEFEQDNLGDLKVGTFLMRAEQQWYRCRAGAGQQGTPDWHQQPGGGLDHCSLLPSRRYRPEYDPGFRDYRHGHGAGYGFKYLGFRGYLAKFFPFIAPGFGKAVGKDPIKAIDPIVGLLELVSEISKVISFAFRLLGNLFAGMVLLFVMAFLLPVANMAFFGLEFFVGMIQALVFGLLMLIFMLSATVSHHDDDHH
jgi:hypothetical protein